MEIASIPKFIKTGPKSGDNVHLGLDLDGKVIACFDRNMPHENSKNEAMKAMAFSPNTHF
jgi:hypothetical protein